MASKDASLHNIITPNLKKQYEMSKQTLNYDSSPSSFKILKNQPISGAFNQLYKSPNKTFEGKSKFFCKQNFNNECSSRS